MKPVILLTGRPGVGKTAVIKSVVSLLNRRAGGFYTRELRSEGSRTGFEIVTLDGRTGWLASKSSTQIYKEELTMGKYRVNLRAIDSIAVPALHRALKAGRLIVIDEIGPMEIASELFRQTVLEILNSNAAVVGTVVQRPNVFADRVKAHHRVRLQTVTVDNRNRLPPQIFAELAHS